MLENLLFLFIFPFVKVSVALSFALFIRLLYFAVCFALPFDLFCLLVCFLTVLRRASFGLLCRYLFSASLFKYQGPKIARLRRKVEVVGVA